MEAAWNVFGNTLGQKTFPLLSFCKPVGLGGTAYKAGGLVSHQGELFRAVRDGSGGEPARDPGLWAPLQ
ncbi:hypothetical protein [Actinomadura coerulea]|uniref:hypothetical protein n=1 Tax=Actinomadura coerulea TaxID=46159 RepID=UPI0034495F69